jgi:hypothetical protein
MEMILHELTMNVEGEISMNADNAGRINGKSYANKTKVCVHQRMVNCHYNEKGKPTGNVVCWECGAVIPDPVRILG